jgi:hypothetical protein
MNDAARAIRKLSLLGAWMLVIHLSHPGFAQGPQQELAYFQLSRVPSAAQRFLLAAGTRLRRPGKERITAVGTLSARGVVTPVEITLEFPQRIRIDDGRGTVIFDRANPSEAVPQKRETADAIETLLEDSLEGFFAAQRGGSVRSLGAGFRGKTGNPEEPSFEIAEVWGQSRFRNGAEPTIKQYWFDSRTKLLSRVVYRVASAPGSDLVEVLWSDWRDVEGERVPFRVERKEAGQVTLQLVLTSVFVSPKADDGRFPGR